MKFPQSKKKELGMILDEDSNLLVEYISLLIDKALGRFELSEEKFNSFKKHLQKDILIAKRRFLKNFETSKNYKFSVYYTWYIHELLKNKKLKKKPGK